MVFRIISNFRFMTAVSSVSKAPRASVRIFHPRRLRHVHPRLTLVSHHEGSLILAVEVTAQLKRTMALCAVDEDRNSQEIVADRELTAWEDRARCEPRTDASKPYT